MKQKVLFVILGVYSAAVMAQNNLGAFFPEVKNDLTKITWAHAVNTKSQLDAAIKSNTLMMLEADVLIGNLTTDSTTMDIPIMGHPPATTSDLSLEQFMIAVSDYNKQNTKKKGVKLDFKTFDAFDGSISILRNYTNSTYPIWLNADILKGPGNSSNLPVSAPQFLSSVKEFPNSTLSLGWTTNYNNSMTNVSYTTANIEEMLKTITGLEQPITFPVRAVYVAESGDQMKQLLGKNISSRTLTVWSADDDDVDAKKLKQVILDIGKDKVYVDVPKSLMDELGLNSGSKIGVNVMSVLLFSFITVLLSRNL